MTIAKLPGQTVDTYVADLDASPTLLDLVAGTILAPSRAEARRLIKQGAIYVNGWRCEDPARPVTRADVMTFGQRRHVDICTKHRRQVVWIVPKEDQ